MLPLYALLLKKMVMDVNERSQKRDVVIVNPTCYP